MARTQQTPMKPAKAAASKAPADKAEAPKNKAAAPRAPKNQLMSVLKGIVDETVDSYNDLILARVEAGETLTKDVLQELWTQACGVPPNAPAKKKAKIEKSEESEEEEKKTCPTVLTRGDRKGEACGKPVSKDGELCAAHAKAHAKKTKT